MRKREIKRICFRMDDEELIKTCKEEYLLAKDESNASIIGFALLIVGTMFLITIVVPLFFYPLGLFLMLTRPRKHTKISKIMMKEVKERGYKCVEKVHNYNGMNTYELIIIKNRFSK